MKTIKEKSKKKIINGWYSGKKLFFFFLFITGYKDKLIKIKDRNIEIIKLNKGFSK